MFEKLNDIQDLDFTLEADLSRYSTMRLKSVAPLATAKTVEAVSNFVKICQSNKYEYRLLGWGANQLLVDHPTFVYLHLDLDAGLSQLDNVQALYHLSASVSLAKLTAHAARHGLKGWEVFTGIPASLGGAIFMNAGTNLGEIGAVVKRVGLIGIDGKERIENINDKSFSYRHNNFCRPGEVIIWAELTHKGIDLDVTETIKAYLKMRNNTQPLREATCGCMFKNANIDGMTCRAGLSIDIMGLKGLTLGGVRVSHKHANFMENTGEASREDVLKLSQFIQDELKLSLGVDFELEVDTGER